MLAYTKSSLQKTIAPKKMRNVSFSVKRPPDTDSTHSKRQQVHKIKMPEERHGYIKAKKFDFF